MRPQAHLAAGTLLGVGLLHQRQEPLTPLQQTAWITFTALAANLPDTDMIPVWLARLLPATADSKFATLQTSGHHHWPSHSPLPWMLFGSALQRYTIWQRFPGMRTLFGSEYDQLPQTMMAAVLVHLGQDMISDGVVLAWPLPDKIGLHLDALPEMTTKEWWSAYSKTTVGHSEYALIGAAALAVLCGRPPTTATRPWSATVAAAPAQVTARWRQWRTRSRCSAPPPSGQHPPLSIDPSAAAAANPPQ